MMLSLFERSQHVGKYAFYGMSKFNSVSKIWSFWLSGVLTFQGVIFGDFFTIFAYKIRGRAKIGISTETRETSVFYAILPIYIQYAEFFRFCWFLTVCRAKHWTLPILLELADLMKFTGSSFLPGKPSKMDKIEKFLCIMSRQID